MVERCECLDEDGEPWCGDCMYAAGVALREALLSGSKIEVSCKRSDKDVNTVDVSIEVLRG